MNTFKILQIITYAFSINQKFMKIMFFSLLKLALNIHLLM